MHIETVEITTTQLRRLLTEDEGHFLDFKSINVSPAKLSKNVSAFSNAGGGELYIGIEEDTVGGEKIRAWRGFANPEAANSHLQLFEELFPLGQYYSYTFLKSPSDVGLVLQVNINKTAAIMESSDGTVYIRRGAQSLPVKSDEGITRLRYDKGIQSFEKETVGVEISLISRSEPIKRFLNHVVPTAEPEQWLVKQQLISSGKATVAGVVLFAEEPQAILPKRCGVKIYHYRTTDEEGSRETLAFDPITIEGCLYDQVKQTVAKTVELVEGLKKLGPKGLEPIKYPFETLHEILTNALLHRDYSIAADVHVRIFDNRIEVESPGRLPGYVTPRNILQTQLARNGAIVRMINKFPDPPNKDVGEGLKTAFAAMNEVRLQPPVIRENDNSVIVHIRHEPLASIDSLVMEYLGENEEITNRIARQITGQTSERKIRSAFDRLKAKSLIEQMPNRPRGRQAWRKVK